MPNRDVIILVPPPQGDSFGAHAAVAEEFLRGLAEIGLTGETLTFDQNAMGPLSEAVLDPDLKFCVGAMGFGVDLAINADGRQVSLWDHVGKVLLAFNGNPACYPNPLRILSTPARNKVTVFADLGSAALGRRIGAALAARAGHGLPSRTAYARTVRVDPGPVPPRPLAERSHLFLFCGQIADPDEPRRNLAARGGASDADLRLVDITVERGLAQPTVPVWRHFEAAATEAGRLLDLGDPGTLTLLECATRVLTMTQKLRLLEALAAVPGLYVVRRLGGELPLHPDSRVLDPVPFGRLLDLMGDARALVGANPNAMPTAVSERVANAAARGALVVNAENRMLRRLLGDGARFYDADHAGLGEALTALRDDPAGLQPAADLGRTRAEAAFSPARAMRRLVRIAAAQP